jgi:hypothetical protein
MRIIGSLIQRGQVVASSLPVTVHMQNRKWSGEIDVPRSCPLQPGSFQLLLADGRRGNITIASVSQRSGRSIFFEGDGALT